MKFLSVCNRALVSLKLVLSVGVVAAFAALPGPSHAATIYDLGINTPTTQSKNLGLFGSGDGLLGLRVWGRDFGGDSISVSYLLEADGDAQTYSAAFSNPNPGNFGIADLFLTWWDDASNVLSSQRITDASGVLTTTSILMQALSDTKNYTLQLSGTLLEKGGAYLLLLGADDAPAVVPLPAGFLLLLTGLGGVGLLGRYKAKRLKPGAA